MDLPVWQALRTELHPRGLEIVTVALDIDATQARPWIEAASADHPALIDSAHLLDELPRLTAMIEASEELRLEREPYQAAIRDWVERGEASPYALSPNEVVARS